MSGETLTYMSIWDANPDSDFEPFTIDLRTGERHRGVLSVVLSPEGGALVVSE